MKLIIFAFAILALVSADWTAPTGDEIKKFRQECFEETKLSDHCIDMVKKGEFPHDPGCYFRCLGLKTGMWDDTHGYDTDRAYQTIYNGGYDLEKENLSKCATEDRKDDDKCVWAANVAKCLWDNKYVKRRTA